MSIFPEEMKSKSSGEMSLEEICSKLTYYHLQLHLIHWQTTSIAQHEALGKLYDFVQDFKDDVVEKLIGYGGKRPKAFRLIPLTDSIKPEDVVKDLGKFAYNLEEWAEGQEYCDIENMAQDLSGHAAKTLYLLTLS